LHGKRKDGFYDDDDYSALTLALLYIKSRRGSAALFDGDIVRAYLSDLLPRVREMRLLSALVFDTDAINHLRDDPKKAFELLKARGVNIAEAERLIGCFADAFAVRVDYSDLSNEALLAAIEYGDTEAMYILATRYYGGEGPTDDDDNDENYFQLLQRAADMGHEQSVALLESSVLWDDEDEE
jgi:TPR repeat protein